MIPSRISGQPISAGPSLMTRKSQASASSQPPPSACPAISATTGFGRRCTRRNVALGQVDAARRLLGREVRVGERLELRAGHEDRLVGAREHDGADGVIPLEQVEQEREVGVELLVERVRRRLVEHAEGDRVVALDGEETRLGEIGIQTLVW